jgi:hypothetical protein
MSDDTPSSLNNVITIDDADRPNARPYNSVCAAYSLSSARHYGQIRFRFHTTKTRSRHRPN